MALMKIYEYPHPVLKKKAEPVKEVNAEIRKLLDDMLETMYDAPGVGLAAPQVGVSKRVIVIDISHDEDARTPIYMVNPEIIWKSDEISVCEEGCLSVPKQYAEVERPASVTVRYLDRLGMMQEFQADDFLATAVQHEIDHLDGILYVDRLSRLKKNMLLKKLKKYQEERAEDGDKNL